jgi:hypothetical protein
MPRTTLPKQPEWTDGVTLRIACDHIYELAMSTYFRHPKLIRCIDKALKDCQTEIEKCRRGTTSSNGGACPPGTVKRGGKCLFMV